MSHAARALTVIALMLPVSAVTGTFFSVLPGGRDGEVRENTPRRSVPRCR